jgi:hypothetical protein
MLGAYNRTLASEGCVCVFSVSVREKAQLRLIYHCRLGYIMQERGGAPTPRVGAPKVRSAI